MATQSKDRLERDLKSVEFLHGVDQGFWELIDRNDCLIYAKIHAQDGRDFLIRLDCDDYWNEPILGEFVDPKDRSSKSTAWPDGNGQFEQWIKFRNPPHFICWDQDRAGIQHHSEWRSRKAWQKKENQIVGYLEFLVQMLYLPIRGYNRRTAGPGATA